MNDHFGHMLRAAFTHYGAHAVDRIVSDSDLLRIERERKRKMKHRQRSIHNAASRLLRLPAEIRNQIYQLLVVQDTTIEVIERGSRYRLSPDLKQPPLSLVCRQIRHEVLSVFYSENTFNITIVNRRFGINCELVIVHWLRNLSEAHQKALGSIGICTTLSSPAVISRKGCSSELYNLADDRVCGGVRCARYYASELRLKGWTWKGDVGTECGGVCARAHGVGVGEMHHHALVWAG
ncbi:hypothetical protein M409DRAFT_24249 [Zasmidium cellare ATCC 36951]|uniref:F-box domain-containing protein n=1 Tax=Zasmidium cellare ATCC 36951 TaxID=1080233 RepID=A0A6A6CI76_ZASCE|nr:uncharacterized protein M409DRAFT_24249 [Zasmidium cellare ATCC 36951]KAF2165399.1 hypothetical protein M409DRAFT_24249 [Zasmidium cellare ATCC 36951]